MTTPTPLLFPINQTFLNPNLTCSDEEESLNSTEFVGCVVCEDYEDGNWTDCYCEYENQSLCTVFDGGGEGGGFPGVPLAQEFK